MNKYLVRKLLFVIALGLAVYAPIGVTAYQSRNTTDPYILIARELEGFEKGGVDVLNVLDDPGVAKGVTVVLYIKDYPDWSVRFDQSNFNQLILQAIAKHDFEAAGILIGWDFPPDVYRVQGVWICSELRRSSCEWEKIPSVIMQQRFVVWPGIGKP